MSTRLSANEIANQELIIDFDYSIVNQSQNTQKVLLKILDTIETDTIYLSDGEVIDMIHSFLNKLGTQRIVNEKEA